MARLTKLHINRIKAVRRILPTYCRYLPRYGGTHQRVMDKTPWLRGCAKSRPAIASRTLRMRRSGIHFSTQIVEKVQVLLATTDLGMTEIAERIGCSRSAVASINNKYRIRIYGKKRISWTLNKDFPNKS